MLKYLIILLDNSSVSFCHYQSSQEKQLISADALRKAIRFAMVENLNVQFVWPDYELPEEHKEIISSVEHTNIVPISLTTDADILVAEPNEFESCPKNATIVARLSLDEFLYSPQLLAPLFEKASRLNIVITDPENFHDEEIEPYRKALKYVSEEVAKQLKTGHDLQVNLITDRMILTEMNNCNAGYESLTVGPDGNFYVCPAFYYGSASPIGSVGNEPDIKNQQLYRLDHAPICRECDAWHCRRCVWLNKNATLEVNTPGHEQCVMAHLEREAARSLSENIRATTGILPGEEITKLDYLDPFDKIINR